MAQCGAWERPNGQFAQEVPTWGSSKNKASIIVAAARILYERQGIHSTSITQIAREIGITRELFYYYFGNKSEVTEYVMKLYSDEIVALLKQRIENVENEPDFMRALVGVLREFLYTDDGESGPRVKVMFEAQGTKGVLLDVAKGVRECMRQVGGRSRAGDDEAQMLIVEHMVMGVFALLEAHPDLDAELLIRGIDLSYRQWRK